MPSGVYVRTQEARDNIRKARLGKIASKESCEKRSKSLTESWKDRKAIRCEIVCGICSRKFLVTEIKRDKAKYCSHKCYYKSLERKGKLRIPRETRICKCGCEETFVCKENSDQRFIHGHAVRVQSRETKDKRSRSRLKRKEELGYINSPSARKKSSDSALERWQNPVYKDSQIKAIFKYRKVAPNIPEKFLFSIVDKLFPNQYLLNTKGEHARPAGKLPDIVNIKEKKCIEHYGDYYHANVEYCNEACLRFVEGIPVEVIRNNDKERINLIEKEGWKVLVVWNHELKDIDNVINKIIEFQAL